jgi:hypothetical protein
MNMLIAPPFAHFPFAEDNITTSIAENSIATSGGVKVSQPRMSFALQSTGNSYFSFDQDGGGMQATAEWLDQLPRSLCTMNSTRQHD